MKITEVRITKSENAENPIFRGSASILLDNDIIIHNIAILEGPNGLYVSFPDRRLKSGQWADIVHPANTETRQYIQDVILEKFVAEEE